MSELTPYQTARLRWLTAKEQADESLRDYLTSKTASKPETVFIAAVIAIEARCLEVKSYEEFEDLVIEENAAEIAVQRLAAS